MSVVYPYGRHPYRTTATPCAPIPRTWPMDIPNLPDPSEPPDSDPASERADDASDGADGSAFRHRLQLASNLVTLLVAVSAISLSVWEGCEMRRHNRLAVLPNLDANARNLVVEAGATVTVGGQPRTVDQQQSTRRVSVSNTGLGPAVVRKALVFPADAPRGAAPVAETQADGESVSLYSIDALLARLQAQYPGMLLFTGAIVQGAMLQAGDALTFYEAAIPTASVPDTTAGWQVIRDRVVQYSFVICYCSVYGEDCDQEHIGAEPPRDNVCTF